MAQLPSFPSNTGAPERHSTGKANLWTTLVVGFVVLALLVGLVIWTLNYYANRQQSDSALTTATSTPVAQATVQTEGGGLSGPKVPTPTTGAALQPSPAPPASSPDQAQVSLRTLEQATVPARDLYALTRRIKLKTTNPIPSTTGNPPGNYSVGHTDIFYVTDPVAKRYYTMTATVRLVTEHVYWYTQDGQRIDDAALRNAARNFEDHIYPTDHAVFGTEWTPGVDNDPRITVLFANLVSVGGYYSSADEYTRTVNPFSNQREMIYINIGDGWYGVESILAHEFQHMIHWNERPDHDVWLNEGCSELASALNGYDVGGVDDTYLRNPDVQLNAWEATANASRPHYGASFLFLDFLRQHFGGDKAISSIVSASGEGIDAINNALASTGSKARFDDVYEQWLLANLVSGQSGAAEKGLSYSDRQPQLQPQVTVDQYPGTLSNEVAEFGTDYIALQPPPSGSHTLAVDFKGQPQVGVISAPAHSGSGIWWSNRGDVADTTMTRSFDLTKVSSAALSFYTWFDTEDTLDYAYVEASIDAGLTWDTLKGAYTSSDNPNGTNLGNGYTGESASKPGADAHGWLHEQIDLGPYTGKHVMIRFEYITDDGYNAQGFAVDDISIPQIGFTDDAESDTGWSGAGFVHVYNVLPQRYYVAVVKLKSNGFDVQAVGVGPSGSVSFTIDGLGTTYDKAVLVVSGLTPYILQRPHYDLSINAK